MPAGLPYFAWIFPSETTFGPEHMRWDENIFSFTLSQEEGDPASLTAIVRRPRNEAGDPIGLLGPGRKIWAWFAFDCGPDLIKFRGRLVGVPTSIFEELVTLEFIARPFDVVAQKEAVADTLRVLPHYDEVVIDKERRTDPEVVLEGYTKIWHYDRESHILTVSDEIIGEDGLVEFDGETEAGKVLWDVLSLTLTSGPLARVDVAAEFTWTQQGFGTVDLTNYLIAHWPNEAGYANQGVITSYTFSASNWPKHGASIGDGWEVAEARAYDLIDTTVKTQTVHEVSTHKSAEGDSRVEVNYSVSYLGSHPKELASLLEGHGIVTMDDFSVTRSGLSRNITGLQVVVPIQAVAVTLVAGYKAGRPHTEFVTFTLFADVQHILTDPEDGEALRIDDIKSVNLSEPIGEGTGAYVPMVDSRRRSYIATERGNRSVEHLIALARAHLMKRARVVEIKFAPKLERMPEITLRKNAFLVEPRVGEAVGKIVGYSLSLDGSDGRINCEVRIGCTIGRGGAAVATEGTPDYVSIDYTDHVYQQFTDRTVLLDTSVGYQPPAANPNDDGINFLSHLTAEDVIDTPPTVENSPEEQRESWEDTVATMPGPAPIDPDKPYEPQRVANVVAALHQTYQIWLKAIETKVVFKLKSMTGEFETPYEVQVTDLKIPTGIDLEQV